MENLQNTLPFWTDLNANIFKQTCFIFLTFKFLIIVILQSSELLLTNEMLCSISPEDKLTVGFCLSSF